MDTTCTYTTAIATIIIREYKPHTTGAFLGECGEGLAGCVTHHHTMFPWYLHALPHCLPCQLLCQSEANLDREIIGENQQSSCLTERKNGQSKTFSLTSHTLRRVWLRRTILSVLNFTRTSTFFDCLHNKKK